MAILANEKGLVRSEGTGITEITYYFVILITFAGIRFSK
jgi:hypothetical protein